MLRHRGRTASPPMGGREIHYAWFIAAMAAVLQLRFKGLFPWSDNFLEE